VNKKVGQYTHQVFYSPNHLLLLSYLLPLLLLVLLLSWLLLMSMLLGQAMDLVCLVLMLVVVAEAEGWFLPMEA
jgi:hypothetical protein